MICDILQRHAAFADLPPHLVVSICTQACLVVANHHIVHNFEVPEHAVQSHGSADVVEILAQNILKLIHAAISL